MLTEAKQAYWRAGCRITPEFRAEVKRLLLVKLAKVGETTEDDEAWAEAVVEAFLGSLQE